METSRRSVGTTLLRGLIALHAGLQTVASILYAEKVKQISPLYVVKIHN